MWAPQSARWASYHPSFMGPLPDTCHNPGLSRRWLRARAEDGVHPLDRWMNSVNGEDAAPPPAVSPSAAIANSVVAGSSPATAPTQAPASPAATSSLPLAASATALPPPPHPRPPATATATAPPPPHPKQPAIIEPASSPSSPRPVPPASSGGDHMGSAPTRKRKRGGATKHPDKVPAKFRGPCCGGSKEWNVKCSDGPGDRQPDGTREWYCYACMYILDRT